MSQNLKQETVIPIQQKIISTWRKNEGHNFVNETYSAQFTQK